MKLNRNCICTQAHWRLYIRWIFLAERWRLPITIAVNNVEKNYNFA